LKSCVILIRIVVEKECSLESTSILLANLTLRLYLPIFTSQFTENSILHDWDSDLIEADSFLGIFRRNTLSSSLHVFVSHEASVVSLPVLHR
jgi:hypothetical protein